MKLLILSQRYSRDSRIVQHAARELGYETYRIQGSTLPEWIKDYEVSVYCEGFMAEFISQQTGIAILRPPIDALSHVPEQFLKRQIQFKKIEDIKELTKPTFIKPADQKFFTAGVYSSLSEITGYGECPKSDPLFISEVVEFINEFRLFCYDGKVQGYSQYIEQTEFIGDQDETPAVPKEIINFGNQVLQNCTSILPPGVVVDVGHLKNGELALIEFNPAWASGVYGTGPVKAVECINKSCIQRKAMTKELEKF